MAFDVQVWRERVAQQMAGWKSRWEKARPAGVSSLYAFLSAMALWPVVEAVRQKLGARPPASSPSSA